MSEWNPLWRCRPPYYGGTAGEFSAGDGLRPHLVPSTVIFYHLGNLPDRGAGLSAACFQPGSFSGTACGLLPPLAQSESALPNGVQVQLYAVDHSAHASMKSAASCVN